MIIMLMMLQTEICNDLYFVPFSFQPKMFQALWYYSAYFRSHLNHAETVIYTKYTSIPLLPVCKLSCL